MTYPESDFITIDGHPATAARMAAEQDAVRTALRAYENAVDAGIPDAVTVALLEIAPRFRESIRPALECMEREWSTGEPCDCGVSI